MFIIKKVIGLGVGVHNGYGSFVCMWLQCAYSSQKVWNLRMLI
jgi:hypothetical protein